MVIHTKFQDFNALIKWMSVLENWLVNNHAKRKPTSANSIYWRNQTDVRANVDIHDMAIRTSQENPEYANNLALCVKKENLSIYGYKSRFVFSIVKASQVNDEDNTLPINLFGYLTSRISGSPENYMLCDGNCLRDALNGKTALECVMDKLPISVKDSLSQYLLPRNSEISSKILSRLEARGLKSLREIQREIDRYDNLAYVINHTNWSDTKEGISFWEDIHSHWGNLSHSYISEEQSREAEMCLSQLRDGNMLVSIASGTPTNINHIHSY